MNVIRLVPNIFYTDIRDTLKLFADCPGFHAERDKITSRNPFCVVAKGDLRVKLFQNHEPASEHHPEFRLVTDDIDTIYQKIADSNPELLHPNLNEVILRPRGAGEFAIRDKQRGIVIQQW